METTIGQFVRIVCVIPTELVDAWESAKTRLQREGLVLRSNVPEAIHHGQILECLVADYLAGPEYPPESRWPDISKPDTRGGAAGPQRRNDAVA